MKVKFGRHFSSVVLGLMVIGLMGPAVLRAQSGQTPPSSTTPSNAQSTGSTTNSTTGTKKSKKSKSTATTDAGGTSGSTAGGGTSGSTAAPASSTKTAAPASTKAAAPSIAASPATADTHAPSNNKTSAAGSTPPSPGMVWVNTSTKVYHKSGSKYYGNTKQGKWMNEGDAQKAGYKAASN
jgi:cytoskeletal protein RodZ